MLHYCLADVNFGPRFGKRSSVQQTIETPSQKKGVLSTATIEAKRGNCARRSKHAETIKCHQIFVVCNFLPFHRASLTAFGERAVTYPNAVGQVVLRKYKTR